MSLQCDVMRGLDFNLHCQQRLFHLKVKEVEEKPFKIAGGGLLRSVLPT